MVTELASQSLTQLLNVSPLLVLISHAHTPPLVPSPRLKYDLRTVPNPPKAIRDAYTGVSKRLRDHMLEHEDFVKTLDRAEGEITAEMDLVVREWQVERGRVNLEDSNNQEFGLIENGVDAQTSPDHDDSRPILVVGVFCARGKHRSVAFVEELGRRVWPREWEVNTSHRDVAKGRQDQRGQKTKGRKVRETDTLRDDEEEGTSEG
jgi:RNase adaptor protein for sRNA GlmZ degradation